MSKFRAGDVVKHKPSGEKWVVAAVRGEDLLCVGWPESMAPFSDCEMHRPATDEWHEQTLRDVIAGCRGQTRASWALENLEGLNTTKGAKP